MHKFLKFRFLITGILISVFAFGCSGGSAITPDEMDEMVADTGVNAESSHNLWGLWQFTADPDAGTLEYAQLRTGELHLNALPFLEPPMGVNLTVESVHFAGANLEAGIGLRHPFVGLAQFTGFDVCGIFMSIGSVSGFGDPDIVITGETDTRLMNADGGTRWWNPSVFDPIDFDPGPDADNHSNNMGEDIFLTKLLPNGYWEE